MKVINVEHLSKQYKDKCALKDVSLQIKRGSIVGLVGTNGAGKTTLLKSLLGLCSYDGNIEVLGFNPRRDRMKLMNNMCFIADVAILPSWLKVSHAIEFVRGVHPKFNHDKALAFISRTNLSMDQKVGDLSKGMIVQLHLALVMAIDVAVLILDEPTLGLDIMYRKHFYQSLINDYYNEDRTILITTHQVEEVESILTDVIMLHAGQKILDCSMSDLAKQYYCIRAKKEYAEELRKHHPIAETHQLGHYTFMFDCPVEAAEQYGEVYVPGISDVFVAKVEGVLV